MKGNGVDGRNGTWNGMDHGRWKDQTAEKLVNSLGEKESQRQDSKTTMTIAISHAEYETDNRHYAHCRPSGATPDYA